MLEYWGLILIYCDISDLEHVEDTITILEHILDSSLLLYHTGGFFFEVSSVIFCTRIPKHTADRTTSYTADRTTSYNEPHYTKLSANRNT